MNDENRVRATVYSYWDTDLSRWRHTFTKWDRPADETHEVLLPKKFDLYETEGGETFAYFTSTEPRKSNQYHDAWKVVPYEDGFAIVDAHGVNSRLFPCDEYSDENDE